MFTETEKCPKCGSPHKQMTRDLFVQDIVAFVPMGTYLQCPHDWHKEKCPDALLPDGEICPSGVDGGSWVHFPRLNAKRSTPTTSAELLRQLAHNLSLVMSDITNENAKLDPFYLLRAHRTIKNSLEMIREELSEPIEKA